MCCTSLATSCASSCLWVMLLKTTWHFFVAFSTASGNLPQHLTWLPKGSNLRSVHMLHSHKMSTKSCYVPCRTWQQGKCILGATPYRTTSAENTFVGLSQLRKSFGTWGPLQGHGPERGQLRCQVLHLITALMSPCNSAGICTL